MSMQCRASPEPPVSVEGDERECGGERGAEEADELRRREPADVRVECRRGEGSDDRADRVETALHGLVACRGRTSGRHSAVRVVCRGSARRVLRLSAAGAARGEGKHVKEVLGA